MNLSTKVIQMKIILGSLLLLFGSLLNASSLADYNFSVSNKNPYVKEAVLVTFKARQMDHSDVMFFFLKPKKSKDYKIVLLNKEAQDIHYHDKQTIFTYLLFPKKSGQLSVGFDFVIKSASDRAVAQVYEGGRDNVKWIETTDRTIDLKPISLNVKTLEQPVDLVGDFKISSKLQNSVINAYESTNITYFLQGTGYDEFNLTIIDKIDGVDIFSDVVKHYNKATPNGYKIQREFKYALIANHDFTIPSHTIKCYSPKHNRYYTIKTKAYSIKVKQVDKSRLVDKDEFPKQVSDYSNIVTYLSYILIFISGFVTAKILPQEYNILKRSSEFQDIKNSSSAKELLNILMRNYDVKLLKDEINDLENIVYKNSTIALNAVKKRIYNKLKG